MSTGEQISSKLVDAEPVSQGEAEPVAGGLRERLRTAVRALFREQKRYHEDLDTMLEIDQLLAKLEYIAGPKAWCPECRAPRLYSGDPNSIHLHLCHTCNGVVDDTRETAPLVPADVRKAVLRGDVKAWLADDGTGRVIDAKAKEAGTRAAATASATSVYSIPLYAAQADVARDVWRAGATAPHDKRILGCWLGAPGCHEVDLCVYYTEGTDEPRWTSPQDSFERFAAPDLWMPLPELPEDADAIHDAAMAEQRGEGQ